MKSINEKKKDIIISILILGFLFSIRKFGFKVEYIYAIIEGLIGAALGLIVNETIRRRIEKHFGASSIYKLWPIGVLLGIITSIISFGNIVFTAFGKKKIKPKKISRWEKEQTHLKNVEFGIISISGPLSNIILAIISMFIYKIINIELFFTISFVNLWMCLSNLLPFHPLDGAKVMVWDRRIWLLSILLPFLGLVGIFLF